MALSASFALALVLFATAGCVALRLLYPCCYGGLVSAQVSRETAERLADLVRTDRTLVGPLKIAKGDPRCSYYTRSLARTSHDVHLDYCFHPSDASELAGRFTIHITTEHGRIDVVRQEIDRLLDDYHRRFQEHFGDVPFRVQRNAFSI